MLKNATIIDHYTDDTANESWPDRFGRARRTWHGIEVDWSRQLSSQEDRFQQFLLSSGYVILPDYIDGPITFTARNQVTAYDGEYYRPKAGINLPFTTTGETDSSFQIDKVKFVAVGEAVLRQQLTTVGDGKSADMLPLKQGGTVAKALFMYTPEMFGFVGDNSDSDRIAVQNMLDAMPAGAFASFDGLKTYYNNFGGTGDPSLSWTISKPCSLFLNGAKVSRLAGVEGQSQSSLFFINGVTSGKVGIYNGNLNDNNPIDYPYNNSLVLQTALSKTSICQAIDYGILAKKSSNIDIDCDITQCVFGTFYSKCYKIKSRGDITYSGQVYPNIIASDLAYGAGVKVSDSQYFNIKVSGSNNANATIELEANNDRGVAETISYDNLSSALTCIGTRDASINVVGFNCGVTAQIISNGDGFCRNITGSVISNDANTFGAYIGIWSSVTGDTSGINIKVSSYFSYQFGLYIVNQSTSFSLINSEINYHGDSNYRQTSSGYSANDVVVNGDIRATIIGEVVNGYNGVYISGTNNQNFPPRINMVLRQGLTTPFAIQLGSYADVSGTITKDSHYVSKGSNISTAYTLRMGVGNGDGTLTNWAVKATYTYFNAIPNTFSFNNMIYADTNTTLLPNEKYVKIRTTS